MPGRFAVLVVALAALAVAGGGCGSDKQTVRIGVLTDCQGPLRGSEDAQLSGGRASVPAPRRTPCRAGPAAVTAIEEGGRRIELVRGCQESGEHTVYIEEARRLLETEQVDAIVGGASVVARDLARRYPDVPFVSTFWNEQEVTLRRPASNVFRFSPDHAQQAAGLGTYAYRELGWRRAGVVAGDQPAGWAGAAAFTASSAPSGDGWSRRPTARSSPAGPTSSCTLGAKPDGVAAFLHFLDDPATILGALATALDDPRRLLLWTAASRTRRCCRGSAPGSTAS